MAPDALGRLEVWLVTGRARPPTKRDTGERMDALLQGADWAQMGRNGEITAADALAEAPADHVKVAD